jgi:hypothetical protein
MIVYATIYGGYDVPKPPRPHPEISEWRLYTNNESIYAPGWNVIVEPRHDTHPRMQAKWRKCHPPKDVATSLYLDGSVRLKSPELLENALLKLTCSDWAMYLHPSRSNICDEAAVSASMPKYKGLPVLEQAASYGTVHGLWAGGILARRHTPLVLEAGDAWFAECARWTTQDQISLPVILERYGITPATLTAGGGLWGNTCFSLESHASDR